jgi:hypothetical protein
MSAVCPRLFEVEALRDGRLAGSERTGFERHLAACAVCSKEARELALLGEALRAGESAVADELHVRRERTRLLAAFDGRLVARVTPRKLSRYVVAIAVAAAALAGLLVFLRFRSESVATASHAIVVEAAAGAVWSRRSEGERELIVLEGGELRIEVKNAPGKRALLVLLPDGELVDEGTIFSVRVEAGRTTRVAVEQGRVALRIRGRPALAIGANESFPSSAPPASQVLETARAEAPPPPAAPAAVPAPKPAPADGVSGASEEFRAAVDAYNGGKHQLAAARLARFLARYPRDPRAEDAAYLRVVALQKSGDGAALKAAAEDYLRRYSSGFRRAEVAGLIR